MHSDEYYINIFKDIRSPQWNKKAAALNRIQTIFDPEELKHVYYLLEKRKDDSLRYYFLHAIENNLLTGDPQAIGICLYIAISWMEMQKHKVGKKCSDLVDYFYNDPSQSRYMKITSMRTAWSISSGNRRKVLTQLIGKYRLVEVAPLILENFEEKNQDLILLTIKVLRELQDPRGNRYIKNLLNSGNTEFLIFSLDAIAEIGNFFDAPGLLSFLNHKEIKVRESSIKAIYSLLGLMSPYFIKRFFEKEKYFPLKVLALDLLSKVSNKTSTRFLVDNFLKSTNTKLSLRIEWALHAIDKEILLPIVLKKFDKVDNDGKFKILNLLSEFNDVSCFNLNLKILKSSKYPIFLKMLAFDIIREFNRPESIQILLKYTEDEKDPLCYYALASLLGHSDVDKEAVILLMVAKEIKMDSILHQIILSFLADKKHDHYLNKEIHNYLIRMLRHGEGNNRYLAVLATARFPDVDIARENIFLLHSKDMIDYHKDIAYSLIKQITQNTNLLELDPDLLNNNNFISQLKPHKIKIDLLEKICEKLLEFGINHYRAFLSQMYVILSQHLIHILKDWKRDDLLPIIFNLLVTSSSSLKQEQYFF
jgi:HEAT repeat protein